MGVVTLSQLWENYRRARKEMKRAIIKEKKELKRTVRKIREQGGTSCKLFWTELRGKRRVRRMEDVEGRMVEGEGEVLKIMTEHWEEIGWKREDTEAEMGDVGGHELVMHEEVSWKEVVEVMKYSKKGKEAGPDEIMNVILMHGDGGDIADNECGDEE